MMDIEPLISGKYFWKFLHRIHVLLGWRGIRVECRSWRCRRLGLGPQRCCARAVDEVPAQDLGILVDLGVIFWLSGLRFGVEIVGVPAWEIFSSHDSSCFNVARLFVGTGGSFLGSFSAAAAGWL